ncbi:methyltransferase domain-containing protein [Pseudoxanthomonas wuyuanensis]|uniref:Methyltransferase domain-containing protein n=1 Tax=Pseudoxanthomonas wuyuanensis TaxID=1073196 RepID=A0A286CXD7_9GAMM|nr:methyltransferase domain-containing protein [Pseudoxanthomonas wuyuanensis]KAF1720822.1 SAM-dependent methyltransferase [Pseudoxanthomonas wuyuanensis]SOD51050.1 Methyltransferase domain-containing protein [Pseudoxanthomonas wuyuanensis]
MSGAAGRYVHGYRSAEARRLRDQAAALEELIHAGTVYTAGSAVLEVGCGVGAQTVALAGRHPAARITAVDISAVSLAQARARVAAAGLGNVEFLQADIHALPFAAASFDHIFVCFVLEHLPDPAFALSLLKPLLRPRGTITVVEGDHGSAYFHPDSEAGRAVIACQVELQRRRGGDALLGRRLYPLLRQAGLAGVSVEPRLVYVDGSRPGLAEAFTRNTFAAMVAGIGEAAIAEGLIEPERFAAGIEALCRACEPDAVFCYTFFKAVAACADADHDGARLAVGAGIDAPQAPGSRLRASTDPAIRHACPRMHRIRRITAGAPARCR